MSVFRENINQYLNELQRKSSPHFKTFDNDRYNADFVCVFAHELLTFCFCLDVIGVCSNISELSVINTRNGSQVYRQLNLIRTLPLTQIFFFHCIER